MSQKHRELRRRRGDRRQSDRRGTGGRRSDDHDTPYDDPADLPWAGSTLPPQGRWLEHKTVFSVLAWAVIGGLLLGRRVRGWRGRQATRWLYTGAVLLLLGYAGSRFVLEVVLRRAVE